MEDQLEERLVIIQVDGDSATFPPKGRDVTLATVRQVHSLIDVLEGTDVGVRRLCGQWIQFSVLMLKRYLV